MLVEIGAGLSSLKAAADLLKGLHAASTNQAFHDAKVGLQERILEAHAALLAAQQAQAALLKRIDELEQEIVRHEDWEAESQRYELVELHQGSLTYRTKDAVRGAEPVHHICPACYQKRRKSILQGFTKAYGQRTLACPDCKLELIHSYEPYSG